MTMPERKRYAPVNGWEERTYYVVEAAFKSNNPVARYVFFTGFLHEDGLPGGYNEFFGGDDRLRYADTYYIKPLFKVAQEGEGYMSLRGCPHAAHPLPVKDSGDRK